jgi:hypothetical protein
MGGLVVQAMAHGFRHLVKGMGGLMLKWLCLIGGVCMCTVPRLISAKKIKNLGPLPRASHWGWPTPVKMG